MVDLSRLSPAPLRFGSCGRCPYLQSGTAAICYACAQQTIDRLDTDRCEICEQSTSAGRCGNGLCNSDLREFDYIWAISKHTNTLKAAISSYKYDGKHGWAPIFGRVLLGYLDSVPGSFVDYDLIIPSPVFVGGRRSWDHIGAIVAAADQEAGGRWPFDTTGVVRKTADTDSMVGLRVLDRRRIGRELESCLLVPRTKKVADMNILVFDDVFTSGTTLQAVAIALKGAGARSVAQVTLARAPWG